MNLFETTSNTLHALADEVLLTARFVSKLEECMVVYDRILVKVRSLQNGECSDLPNLLACLSVCEREFDLVREKQNELKRMNVGLNYMFTAQLKEMDANSQLLKERTSEERTKAMFLAPR